MKKVAVVFVLAVIVPSLVLAWMAARSLRDTLFVLDRQQTLLYQNLADTQARAVADHLEKSRSTFAQTVEALMESSSPSNVATSFDPALRQRWPLAEVGFSVDLRGFVLSPSPLANASARKFRTENDRFLCSLESCEIFWNSPKGPINLTSLELREAADAAGPGAGRYEGKSESKTAGAPGSFEGPGAGRPLEDPPTKASKLERVVTPAKEGQGEPGYSKISSGEINFRKLIGQERDGAFARFLQDKLHVLFWHRAAADPRVVFGAQLHLPRFIQELGAALELPPDLRREVCLALLDDTGRPVLLSHPEFQPALVQRPPARDGAAASSGRRRPGRGSQANLLAASSLELKLPPPLPDSPAARRAWKHPFVSAEIGEALPHWELAVYLLEPGKQASTAGHAHLVLGLLLALLVLAITMGSWLIVSDLRRQLLLARQKTDFVSNVSHELKTPLTSIRMFSEMLAGDRVQDEAKRKKFLGIISAEASRLTRLINNVLDFARLERGEKACHLAPCDGLELVREAVETYRPHLEAGGFSLQLRLGPGPAPLQADRDAIVQVLVNLLSNAEKYSGDRREIEVTAECAGGELLLSVLDRGLGIPAGDEERIFEQFHRAHDSLSSGIQGSGLGLTLARQISRQHGGDVTGRNRPDGGSCFTVRLPIAPPPGPSPPSAGLSPS